MLTQSEALDAEACTGPEIVIDTFSGVSTVDGTITRTSLTTVTMTTTITATVIT
jgi:hypothetical protein